MLLLQLITNLCDFTMQVTAGITAPFIFPLSYYPESKVLEVVGSGFITQVLSGLSWLAQTGLYVQIVQFSAMIIYNLIMHLITGSALTLSQHCLNFIQIFIQYIIPSFVGIELPLLAFVVHAK